MARGGFGGRSLAAMLLLGLAVGWLLARHTYKPQAQPRVPLSARISAAERAVTPAVVTIDVDSRGRRGRLLHSQGSGLIVDAHGYIITNRHVIRDGARIAVRTDTGSAHHLYYAHLVGADPDTDLALLKIKAAHPLPFAPLAASDNLAVGDWVVAVGSPFGLANTVTAGIVSAVHRVMDPRQQFETFIQTDAPINPGNSGGPLVNLSGQVVGINTAIYTEGSGYQGIGFALPSDLVRQIYPELLHRGQVTRGSLGVYFESSLDPAIRRIYHIANGVPLTQVAASGPAAKAGLKPGDVITMLNGQRVADAAVLMRDVEFYPVGRTIRVGYTRKGQYHSAELRVANRAQLFPSAAGWAATRKHSAPFRPPTDFGMVLETAPGGKGVRVLGVVPGSFADEMGVNAGDLILQLNRQDVHSRNQWERTAAGLHPGSDVAMLLHRRDDSGAVSRWLVGGTIPPPLEGHP
ncbi:MAG: PDZ domain-containing protein [Acidobacteria bacterium]|nr:MAG: PDZ domain-containing protein [Acidobacteriota bacterium]